MFDVFYIAGYDILPLQIGLEIDLFFVLIHF